MDWQPDYPHPAPRSRASGTVNSSSIRDEMRKCGRRAEDTLRAAPAPRLRSSPSPSSTSPSGRAHLLAVQRSKAAGDLAEAALPLLIKASVDGLRRAGFQEHLPLGLLARAALHTHTHAFDLARKDLDEALTLATRCGFRLHETDAHLGHARLALAEGSTPAAALPHLTAARALIAATGYHRRDEELATLERALAQATAPQPPAA